MEEKIQERREFRSIVEEFRYTNKELYQKMSQAGETRNSALFNKKAKWKLATVLPQVPKKGGKRPKSARVEKEPEAVEPEIDKGKVEEILDENDSVIQSLKWAHDILLKEHTKRKQTRTKRGSIKRKAESKIHGMWTVHHLNEERKKAKTKKTGEVGIYENMKKEEPNKRDEIGALVDDIPKLMAQPSVPVDDDEDYSDDEYAPKKKFEIVDLKKKLSFRRKTGKIPSKALNRSWEAKTEEDKINDAKKHLAWLQEKQQRNIIVDFFGVPKTKSSSVIVIPSVEPAKNGANESNAELSHNDSIHLSDKESVDGNKNTEGDKGIVSTK